MGRTVMGFSVSPYVVLFCVFAAWSGRLQEYCAAMACILLHELGHAVACDLLGFAPGAIRVHAFGASLQTDEALWENPRAQALAAAAGPAASFTFGMLFYMLYQAADRYIFRLFFLYHIAFGAFNLLPALPMDGGRVLHTCLAAKWGVYKAQRICRIVGIFVGICLILWSFAAWRLYGINVPLFCIGATVVLFALRQSGKISSFVLSSFQKQQHLKKGGALPMQVLAVSTETPLWKIEKFLRRDRYTHLEVYNGQMQLVGRFGEMELVLAAAQLGKNTMAKQLCKGHSH